MLAWMGRGQGCQIQMTVLPNEDPLHPKFKGAPDETHQLVPPPLDPELGRGQLRTSIQSPGPRGAWEPGR